jgi:hypothetical protein
LGPTSSTRIRPSVSRRKNGQQRNRTFLIYITCHLVLHEAGLLLYPSRLERGHSDPARPADTTFITLATAHPAKFSSAVELALDNAAYPEFDFARDVLPDELRELEGMKKRIYKVKGEEGVRALIEKIKGGGVQDPSPDGAASI